LEFQVPGVGDTKTPTRHREGHQQGIEKDTNKNINTDTRKSMRTLKGMRLVDLPLDANGGSVHTLYLKAHSNDDGNTLFVGNVDYGTQRRLQLLKFLSPHLLAHTTSLT